ncbi:MAG TPA: efflux RND transporter periplasmic adaptor subunit [Phycisphaerae bacterium]|nr:efflux RND transporter periplasmic adaptor subunit [Phycisphaerae bacterium]
MVVRFVFAAVFALSGLLTLEGCNRAAAGPAAGGGGAPPAPKVTAAKPLVKNVTQWDDYPGRLSAVETVDVRAQVSGFVQSVSFTEGAMVKKGDLLLTIDSRIFDAQLENAKAELLQDQAKLEQAQAALQLSQNDYKRAQQVSAGGGITAEELDTRRANVAQAEANVSVAKAGIAAGEAQVNAAKLNVDWCRVTAPISGQISNKKITPGNMLTGGSGTNTDVATTIKSVDPMYCYVDVDEAAVLRYQKLAREEKRSSAEQQQIACYLQLGNETGFPHTGVIDFVDNRIDPATSTRRARGVFRNPDGIFTDGNFAVLRVAGEELKDAMLVIDDAIGTDQDKRYLWILKPDYTLERRTVTVGPRDGELRVVRTNLRADELVIVNGLASLMLVPPGGKVDPVITEMPLHRLAAASASAPASGAATTNAAAGTAPATAGTGGGK